MAEVTSRLVYEPMKRVHERFDRLDYDLTSLRGRFLPMQTNIHNSYGILNRTTAGSNESSVVFEAGRNGRTIAIV